MTTSLPRLCAILLAAALGAGCNHSIASPDGGLGDGGDAGETSDGGGSDAGLPDAGPVIIKVKALFPTHGPAAGGNTALVSGSGFVNGFAARGGASVSQVTTVTVGGKAATGVDVVDDNRLQITLPAGAGGPADVTVANPNGSGTCAGCYRYQSALSVTAIEPARGTSAGGTAVTVRGTGFTSGLLLLVGGRALVGLTVVDGQTATGRTPPGTAGGADVLALTRDAAGELRRGFVYQDALALDAAAPPVGPTAGGTRLTLVGRGFSARAAALIGGAPVDTLWIDAAHLAVTAPAHAAGAVDVSVADPDALPAAEGGTASVTLPRGYVYEDAPAGQPGPLLLGSLAPRHGPIAGGTCPQACLSLYGSGLSLADLVVSIAGVDLPAAAVHHGSDSQLTVDLPAGAAPGAAEVRISSAGQGATSAIAAADPGAFHYDPALTVAQIAPAAGFAGGGTAVAISGTGFDQSPGAPLELRIGGALATGVVVAADGRSISAITPAGPGGPADVTVVATDVGGYRRSATLVGGFNYAAPLQLAQVDPATGSQAGGAHVTLYGQGFAAGLSVTFAGHPATEVNVLGPSAATARVPAGEPGAVEVAVTLGAQHDALAEAFTYFDPGSTPGGATGDQLRGTLNVTVFEGTAYLDGGVAHATVAVELADGRTLTGESDARGQITFTDDALVQPCTVTITKAEYTAITLARVEVENVSVYLYGPTPPPPPPPPNPPPPPQPQRPASVSGRVLGFKLPPSVQLGPSQRAVAYVATAASSIYSAPPFQPLPKYLVVSVDGGTWSFTTYALSPTTVYALFGVEDQSTSPPGFEPYLLGIRRAVSPSPDKPITDADIILDTHLDQTVEVSVVGVPSTPRGPVGHDAAVSLDLGSAGAIPLAHVVQGAPLDRLRFTHLPSAVGQGFVFVDEVGLWTGSGITLPASVYLRRVFSDPGPGLKLGPLLPFPVITAPAPNGDYAGVLKWSIDGALQPNLVQVGVNGSALSWAAILPGDARQLIPAPPLASRLTKGAWSWSVTASLAPAFDYAHWTYNDLYSGSWTAYAYDAVSFKVP